MKTRLLFLFALLALFGAPVLAQSCAITSSSLTTAAYDPFGSQLQVQGSVSFNCSRPKGNPRFPAVFQIAVSGANPQSMTSAGNALSYSLFTGYSPCSGAWEGTTYVQVPNTALNPTDNQTLVTPTLTGTFCLQIPASQVATVPGTYSANPTLTINDSSGVTWLSGGTLALTTPVSASCAITTPPSGLTINYTAFGPVQSGTSTFQLRCTNTTPFYFSLDATSGSLLGLPYTLSVPAGGAGSGVAQSFDVTGSIPANQPGICAGPTCSATQTRQLTVSY